MITSMSVEFLHSIKNRYEKKHKTCSQCQQQIDVLHGYLLPYFHWYSIQDNTPLNPTKIIVKAV